MKTKHAEKRINSGLDKSILTIFLTLLLCLPFGVTRAQNAKIEGTIVQLKDGAPVPGANISLLGTSFGSISDLEGRFSIDHIPEDVYELMVSFVGYKTYNETIRIEGSDTVLFNIQLVEDILALDGLIVTAQKRSQLVQDVPIAITTYDGSFLSKTNIFEFDALSDYVPGLQVQIQSVNNPGFVIRGITSDNGDARVEPRVSVFQDGVSISKSRGSVVELYDMERVEVLKGPQGTLFGRGAQIGAIHLIQQKAENKTSAELKAGFGNFNQYLLTGHVNLPIIENKLFARVAGIINEREGFIENLSGGTLNGKDTKAFRTAWRYLPDRQTVIDFIFNYQKDTPPGTAFKSGTYAPAGGDTSPFTFADLERGEELGLDRTVWGATLLVNRSLTNMWDLTSISAYRSFDVYEAFDADGTAAPALWIAEEALGKQLSQEVRVNYNNLQGFSGFGGVNFFWEDGSQATPLETDERSMYALFNPFVRGNIINNPSLPQETKDQLLAAVPALPLVNPDGTPNLTEALPDLPQFLGPLAGLPLKPFHRESQTNFGKNYAFEIFADGTYALTEQLDITLGLRGTYENITGAIESEDAEPFGRLGFVLNNLPNNIFPPTNGRVSHTETYLSAVGRLALDYEISNTWNVFASLSRGRRPNVIQVLGTEVSVLNDETVWSYEAGAKVLSSDNRLQWDINGYYYDYSDFQTQVARLTEDQGLVFEVRDVGNATAYGFETAMQYVVARSLQFFANYGYIHARFDDTDSEGDEQSLAGNTFRLTPEHSGSLGLNVEFPVGSWGKIFFRPTYNYKSRVFFEEANQPNIAQGSYGLLNVRTGIQLWRGISEVAFYMNNALDEKYLIDAGNTGEAFGIPTFIAGPPRMFGIQLSSRLL
ncbi:TonB-dependent receptor [Catalinimonas niigatensis]|uniref:TonB-dependent receptor n=1 Tax=Catalinimonas niigatensis TaxID=1397264 RepID=UPI002666AA0A|nr:TonB-dependent receptor [Catalinimonas niigatensis]WPP52401.1 TonB-dependent receptor [Catalinimonas niigatensis]